MSTRIRSSITYPNARRLADFNRIAIFIDPGEDDIADLCRMWAWRQIVTTEVFVNETRLGVAGNPQRAYTYVFDTLGSDFNVAIEDDAVLMPDALELALWFDERQDVGLSRYAFLNLCDHYSYRGGEYSRGGVPEDPALLAENVTLSAPFAWCLARSRWPFIRKNWNKNAHAIWGWDWSVRLAMRMEGMIALTPVVSRCRNIGWQNATNETAETFLWQLGLPHSDGSHRGDFEIAHHVSADDARRLAPWMIPEIGRYLADKNRANERSAGS